MVSKINFWDKVSLLISVLIFITVIGESIYKDQYMMMAMSNFALVQKTDIINLAVIPMVGAGAVLNDLSILRQAYYLHLINTGESHQNAASKLQEINTLEDYYRLVPVQDTVEKVNKDILRDYRIAWCLNKLYLILSIALIASQIHALRIRIVATSVKL